VVNGGSPPAWFGQAHEYQAGAPEPHRLWHQQKAAGANPSVSAGEIPGGADSPVDGPRCGLIGGIGPAH
jgi:hypothetical protein